MHPVPFVTHLGMLEPTALVMNASQSESVVAVVLRAQVLSTQAVVAAAELVFQHILVPLVPLKLAQTVYVPT